MMASFCVDLTGYYVSNEKAMVHTHNKSGEALMLMFPLQKLDTFPTSPKVHYLNMSSSDGQFYVERLAGHETLKKTNFCVSEEKLQYLIEEFKVEWDFFSTTPPDDVSKLVCQTRFTFLKVGIQLQLELEIWKKDEPKKVDKVVFVKKSKTDTLDIWSSKIKGFNPTRCEDRAKELFLEYRQEMWGIHDGILRGFCEEVEQDEMFKRGQFGVNRSSEGQDVAVGVMSLVIRLCRRDIKKRAFLEMRRRKEYETIKDASNGEEGTVNID